MSLSDNVVHEFELERAGTVRASLSEFRGRERIDLRLWVEPRDQPGGELIPTAKGVNVPVEFLDDLEEAVAALRRAVGRSGPVRRRPRDQRRARPEEAVG
jgi:Transcriptional Coactivator p15 (PC4)